MNRGAYFEWCRILLSIINQKFGDDVRRKEAIVVFAATFSGAFVHD